MTTLDVDALEDALVGGPGRFACQLLAEVWGDAHAHGRVLRAFREARWMSGRRRRASREVLFGVVRRQAWLEAALRAGGWSGERLVEASWARLLVAWGLPAERAAEAFGEACFDQEPVLPEDRRARLALLGSLPPWVIDAVGDLDRAERLVQGLDERAPMTLRCNAPVDDVAAELRAGGLVVEPTRWSKRGLSVEGNAPLGEHAAWREGRVEVQDEGSQLIAELVRPPRRSRVIDLCAGAGGKSLALLASAPRGVRVIACDVRASALKQARKRARRAGVRLTTRHHPPGELPDLEPAPRVLLDAPCTGTGTLRRRPMLRWRLSEAWLQEQLDLQHQLLRRASGLVTEGGRLVYATCSVLRAENEGQVEALLSEVPGLRLVPIAEPLGAARASELGGRFLQLESAVHGSDGFFAAIFQREGPR